IAVIDFGNVHISLSPTGASKGSLERDALAPEMARIGPFPQAGAIVGRAYAHKSSTITRGTGQAGAAPDNNTRRPVAQGRAVQQMIRRRNDGGRKDIFHAARPRQVSKSVMAGIVSITHRHSGEIDLV